MGNYKLSAQLKGHTDDVRSVVFPEPQVVLSASRDGMVRIWKQTATSPPTFDDKISSHGAAFINALAHIPPSSQFPEGLIISGGKEAIIEVRRPGQEPSDDAEALLLGHSGNVCALDVDPTGEWIVSGAWDGQGRIWRVGKWDCDAVLEDHQGSVWAVLAWSPDLLVTGESHDTTPLGDESADERGAAGCADRLLRVFDRRGKLVRTIKGTPDVIRALCRVPQAHPSGAQFASASNDGVIRLWNLEGRQFGELHGHDNFIYSLASLPTGELVSSGEDRTVRIWQGTSCVQTITHPTISVWCVAACAASGDIVSGASDRMVRLFSRAEDRYAGPEAVRTFEEAVSASSIPQQQMGDINKEKLPGPDFLQQKSGTKEGQVAMIREANGNVTAHQWSMAGQAWVSVGTVVDAAGSSGRKQEYLGRDYDYVFEVDIQEGAPALKLPYNLAQNPYEAATSFLQDNELPITYLDQVAAFITSNTQGATLEQASNASAPAGPDPFGIEARYRPGDDTAPPSAPTATTVRPSQILPQRAYLSITQGNAQLIQQKMEEFNQDLIAAGHKDISLNTTDLATLRDLTTAFSPSPPTRLSAPATAVRAALDRVLDMVRDWPRPKRLPALDLLRLLAAVSSEVATGTYAGDGSNVVAVLARSGTFEQGEADNNNTNNMMLGVRTFANLFETSASRALMDAEFDQILTLTSTIPTLVSNRNLQISYTTLLINYAVLLTASASASASASSSTGTGSAPAGPASSSSRTTDRALTLLAPLTHMLERATDSEVIYRALVAAGTLLWRLRQPPPGPPDHAEAVREEAARPAVYDGLRDTIAAAQRKTVEPRVRNVVREMEALLLLV
ncbi:MAG: hypothetical protein M1826_000768 [Phylliscum demangeonii]|nr:MAG: hypothetical protein M1826_000768 [Phylliscum demangeonii]